MRNLLLFCAALLLAACGHNSGSSSPSEDEAASMSVAALIAFGEAQIAQTSDATEPRSLAGIVPPVSDVDEPAAI